MENNILNTQKFYDDLVVKDHQYLSCQINNRDN